MTFPSPSPSRHERATRVLAARASSSSINPVSMGVDIPSSTIISIGLGFVGFALSVLGVLVLLRVFRTYRFVTLERRRGNANLTFRQHWRSQGGFFGFLTNSGADSSLFGASYVTADMERIRRMIEEREWRAKGFSVKLERPLMWEAEVPQMDRAANDAVSMAELCPLNLLASAQPAFKDRALPSDDLPTPKIGFSVLIKLPYQPQPQRVRAVHEDADEDYDDLPDVVIGQTLMTPYIGQLDAQSGSSLVRADSDASMDKFDPKPLEGDGVVLPKGGHGQEVQVENVARPAKWERANAGKWRIEGLDL